MTVNRLWIMAVVFSLALLVLVVLNSNAQDRRGTPVVAPPSDQPIPPNCAVCGRLVQQHAGLLDGAIETEPQQAVANGVMHQAPPAASRVPLIGEKAPAFVAETTDGEVNFPADYRGKWVMLFSHPSDFTPVCTTEFMAFGAEADKFRQLNCELIGLSIDGVYSHIAWLRQIGEFEWNGISKMVPPFPVIADLKMDVARAYGMIQPSASDTKAVRAVFFIDPEGTIRALVYYPLSNGRNVDELLRLLIAMQTSDQHKVATPANWRPGDDVIMPPPGSCGAAAQRVAQAGTDYRCLDWFLCFRKLPKEELTLPE